MMSTKGSSTVVVVVYTAIIVFIILPVFASTVERFIIFNKAQIIKDAVDITNLSTYNSINTANLSKTMVTFDEEQLINIYKDMLMENLNLDIDLLPKVNSIAEGGVEINSIIIYKGPFPVTCPDGTEINRPTVHSVIIVPVRPSLYGGILLDKIGKQFIELRIHVDSDIPIDK